MPAARMALVVYALTTAFAGAELLLSRKELYQEILRQLAPSGFHKVVRVNVTSGKPQAQCAEEHLERHEKCTCMCELDKSHCTSQQVFVESICACHCPDLAEMHLCNGPDRRWDSATCQCTCLEGECSTGFHFSKKECRCVPMEEHRS